MDIYVAAAKNYVVMIPQNIYLDNKYMIFKVDTNDEQVFFSHLTFISKNGEDKTLETSHSECKIIEYSGFYKRRGLFLDCCVGCGVSELKKQHLHV